MFKYLNANSVESTDGYTVSRTQRFEVVYTEGDRSAAVEVEPGDGLAIYSQTLTSWRPPHEDEPMTAADRKRIMERILEAYRFMEVDAFAA